MKKEFCWVIDMIQCEYFQININYERIALVCFLKLGSFMNLLKWASKYFATYNYDKVILNIFFICNTQPVYEGYNLFIVMRLIEVHANALHPKITFPSEQEA